MRECIVSTLILLFGLTAAGQTVPASWQVLKDSKGSCQISVPPEWEPLAETPGAAVFHDATTAIAVVTSQPGQIFKPLSDSLQRLFAIRKEKMFENTPKRIFYQDRISRDANDQNAFSASVPGKGGTCSCRVVFLPGVSAEIARQIALSLGAVPEPKPAPPPTS